MKPKGNKQWQAGEELEAAAAAGPHVSLIAALPGVRQEAYLCSSLELLAGWPRGFIDVGDNACCVPRAGILCWCLRIPIPEDLRVRTHS